MNSELYNHPLFQVRVERLSTDERISISYQRARLLVQTYCLTVDDIRFCSPKYWAFIMDPIFMLDVAMVTILTAHVGLAIGTLSRHIKKRPDLRSLMESLLRFDIVGLYLLTERGHGLDAYNIETTATRTSDGYILNTPREEAMKFMPCTTPTFGLHKVGLAMAKLIVDGQDHGSRFFIVPICNNYEMAKGVTSIRLPPRSGASPLDYCLTSFNNVLLPHPALHGGTRSGEFHLGLLAVPAPFVSAIKAAAFIAGRYSMNRFLVGKGPEPIPIISFRTQQRPILEATAIGLVLSNWYPIVINQSATSSPLVRHALAVIAKTTIFRHFQRVMADTAERCGAQGTFEHNYMSRIENDGRGVIIAEGDILTLCIRLFSELVQGRYQVPIPDPSGSLLARHASSLLHENISLFKELNCDHRSEAFNSLILPQSQSAIEAMGQALAHSEACKSGISKPVLDMYEIAVVRQDASWFSEEGGLTRLVQRKREDAVISSMLPRLNEYLSDLNIENYVSAPIVSDAAWKTYVAALPVYTGSATANFGKIQATL